MKLFPIKVLAENYVLQLFCKTFQYHALHLLLQQHMYIDVFMHILF